MIQRLVPRWLVAVMLAVAWSPLQAADTWTEIKSPHFIVLANGATREARTLAWQLEQSRSAIAAILPWTRVDLDRPFVVMVVNNESKMRALVPAFWERSGDGKPVSVWASGADQHYLAIRGDVQAEDRLNINPHIHAYFSYVSLILGQSLERDMPVWFMRGLAGVLSNTVVRGNGITVGAPIPWHLQSLRGQTRLTLPVLTTIATGSRELTGDGLAAFDAEAWAFVHFLMFADNGARRARVNQFLELTRGGTPPDAALTQAIGPVRQLEAEFVRYINHSIFSFAKLDVDATVKREGFSERTLPARDAAAALALFHTAMVRPVEARAAIAEATKGGAPAPDADLAEGLLLTREDRTDEARAALRRAVQGGSTNAHAYFALARIDWRRDATPEALQEREKLLSRAVELNPRFAWALAMLAEVRSEREAKDALDLIARAIKLDPTEPEHRLTGALILWRQGMPADALKALDAAATLAKSDEDRRRVSQMRQAILKAKG